MRNASRRSLHFLLGVLVKHNILCISMDSCSLYLLRTSISMLRMLMHTATITITSASRQCNPTLALTVTRP